MQAEIAEAPALEPPPATIAPEELQRLLGKQKKPATAARRAKQPDRQKNASPLSIADLGAPFCKVYLALRVSMNERRQVCCRQIDLAEATKQSLATVKRAVKQLCERSLITKRRLPAKQMGEGRWSGGWNVYTVTEVIR